MAKVKEEGVSVEAEVLEIFALAVSLIIVFAPIVV